MNERLPDVNVEQAAPGRAVVVFKGEHDLAHVDPLSERLSSLVAEYELVVADFSEATFVDSAIISALVQTKRDAEASQRRFRIQMGTECVVYRVFELAGVLAFLDCAPTRDDALSGD